MPLDPKHPVSEDEQFDFAVLSVLFEKAEPILRDLLRDRGVSDFRELTQKEAGEVFRKSLMTAAMQFMPHADLNNLDGRLKAFAHPSFAAAMSNVKNRFDGGYGAFDIVQGWEFAVILAALGLPVVPLDKNGNGPLGEPSYDLDVTIASFRKFKTAGIGYSSCKAPFYLAVTDCVRTLAKSNQPNLMKLFERAGGQAPDPGIPFKHGLVLFPRQPGDKIASIFVDDPSPMRGSFVLYAGWVEDGKSEGAPNNGFVPVPAQLMSSVMANPQIGNWLTRPVALNMFMN